jgi:hypothetical protein
VQVAIEYAEPASTGMRGAGMRAILEHLAEQSGDFVGSLYNRPRLAIRNDVREGGRALSVTDGTQ